MEAELGITSLINATFLGEFLAFGCFFTVFYRKVWPLLMLKLDERQATLHQGLEEARLTHEKWESTQLWAEQRSKELQAELETQRSSAFQAMESWSQERKQEAQKQAQALLAAAREQTEQMHHQMRQELEVEMAAWVAEAVQRFVASQAWSFEGLDAPSMRPFLQDLKGKLDSSTP